MVVGDRGVEMDRDETVTLGTKDEQEFEGEPQDDDTYKLYTQNMIK